METPNSIVITKKSNGNVLVTPEGTPYTVQSNSLISKGLNSVTVRQAFSPSSTIEFRVESVEKVVSSEGGEVFISDVDTLFDELNNFFFFEPVGTSSGGGGLPDNYRVVAGAIRNTGSGWELISDGQHFPMNVDSVSNNSASITIDYSGLNATGVVSGIVSPDETFGGVYTAGASIGTSVANIQIKNQLLYGKALVTHHGGGAFSIANSSNSPFSGLSASYASGILTILHDNADGTPLTLDWGGDTVIRKAYNTEGYTIARYKFYNYDGTQQDLANPSISRFSFERRLSTGVFVNPDNLISGGGNFWFMIILKIN